ncbi:MAG: RNA polymerase sigma factor [Phycisphaerales bacterium]
MPLQGSDIPHSAAHADGALPVAGPASRLDAAGFAERFAAASKALWGIAAAIVRDRTEAHDVVQEAAMVALSKLDEFDARSSFVAWAGQIVRFTALNEARRRRRSRQSATDPQIVVTLGRNAPAQANSDAVFDRAVQQALDELDDTQRTCLLMRTTLDLTYPQISEALGIPEGTAMSHVHRARAAMRAALAGSPFASREGA